MLEVRAVEGLVPALLFHHTPEDQMQVAHFMQNQAMAGGLLLLVRCGAGAQLDAAREYRS